MYKRPQEPELGSALSHTGPSKKGKWLQFSNLKLEATVFMLIALTFAAVLGQEAITSQELDLTERAAQYYPYTYGDYDEGGKSSITHDSAKPLNWSCALRPGAQYAYCGYGLHVDLTNTGTGLDMSKYQNIVLKMNYEGVGDHLRLLLQTAVPDDLRDKVKGTETIPLVAEFVVVNGENEIQLSMSQFTVESWWLTSHGLTSEQVVPPLEHVVSVGFSSGSETPHGDFSVSVQNMLFKGTSLSTAQWYLIILGVWLVLTGGFLVYRFLDVRRAYEARQRRQAEESQILAQARAAAEQASAAKSQFLANMSHELRTPLNAIIGYAQLLRASPLSEQQMTAVRTIHHSGDHLLTMITDILDIAKVEAGKLELLSAPFDIRACVHNVGQMVRLRAEEKGLRFAVSIDDDVPQTIFSDQKRVRQVLINLLGNAIKFTSEGEVRLEVSMVSTEPGEVRLRFDVVDTGMGIREDQIGRIFRPFEQVGNAVDRSGGTGLGLSITRQIVEIMQGEITAESTFGQGSRFRIEAPFQLAVRDDAAPSPIAALDCAKYEILVVDNNEANVALLRTALEAQGFRVRAGHDGAEAIDLIDAARPDLVLMDLKMPVLDGLEATRRLRGHPVTQALPIIAITANPTPENEAEARAAGANQMLAKPVNLDALNSTIARVLTESVSPAEASAEAHAEIIAPDGECLERLLAFARSGNLRAIRKEIPAIRALGPQYHGFAERLDALAATYQSPAVLRLIEQSAQERTAA